VVAGLLAAMTVTGPRLCAAADVPGAATPSTAQQPSALDELFSTTTLVHITGALLGYAAYYYTVAPLASPAGVPTSTAETLLTGRMAAAGMAGIGAVAAALAWDRWNGRPPDTSYVWVRGGMIAGFGAAAAAAAWVGLPTSAATWSAGWFANRLFLTGGALLGGYAVANEFGVTLGGAPAAAPATTAAHSLPAE
jgi:hypothetical protein